MAPVRLIAVLALVLLTAGDVVHLKNGGVVRGTIVEDKDGKVVVKTRSGSITIDREDIDRIEQVETPEEALARKRTELKAGDAPARAGLAEWCVEQRLREDAEALYVESLDLKEDAGVRKKLDALVAPKVKSALRRAAMAEFEALAEKYPRHADVVAGLPKLAEFYLAKPDYGAAERWYRRALPALEAYQGLEKTYARMGEWGAVAAIIEESMKLQPDRAAAEKRKALAEKAEKLSDVPMTQASAEDLSALAGICFEFGAIDVGLKRFEDSFTRDPENAKSAVALAELYERGGRWRDALKVLRAAARRDASLQGRLEQTEWRVRYLGELDVKDAAALAKTEDAVNRYLDKGGDVPKLDDVDRRTIEACVRRGRRFRNVNIEDGEWKRFAKVEVVPEGEDRKVQYWLWVPPDYDPLFRYPAMVALHGSNSSGAEQYWIWRGSVREKTDFILIAPTASEYKWGTTTYGHSYVLTPLHEVMREFNVDPNRVYLTGGSMGGLGSFELASFYPGVFAAMSPRIGLPRIMNVETLEGGVKRTTPRYVENLRNTPCYWIVGELDPKIPIDFVRLTRKRMDELDQDLVYHEYEGRGHEWFPEEDETVLRWLQTKVRPRYPSDVDFFTDEFAFARSEWVQMTRPAALKKFGFKHEDSKGKVVQVREAFTPDARIIARAHRKHNRIEVRTTAVHALKLYLHDELVDFDKEIVVTVDGAEKFKGKVVPSLKFMLDEARATGDREKLYWGAVDIDMKPPKNP